MAFFYAIFVFHSFLFILLFYSILLNYICFLQVEFPEARIYEETLNVLLYENRTGPDAELMQATSTRGAVAPVVCTSDDEEDRRGGACSQSGLGRLRSNKNNQLK